MPGFFPFAVFLSLLLIILLLRRASLEGKIILIFASLALSAFLRLHFYLLLFTSLALFSFVLVAFVWAWIASSSLKLQREVKPECLVGETVPVKYFLTSNVPLPFYHVRIWDRASRIRLSGGEDNIDFLEPGYASFLRIRKNEQSEATLHVVHSVRGNILFGPVAVEGGDPFGIFTFVRWLPIADKCLVLPTWVKLKKLPSVLARLGTRERTHLVSSEGQSHELLGVRAYSDGDSLRRVHWPLTAKHNTLIVRQYEREVEEEILVILDADIEADIGEGAENSFEYLIVIANSIVRSASDMGRPWSLAIVASNIEIFSHSMKEVFQGLQYALARLEANRETPIESHLDSILSSFKGSACILLTARPDPEPALALAKADASVGGDLQSMVIRVDQTGFTASIDSKAKVRKKKRAAPRLERGTQTSSVYQVPEIIVSKGDNISDIFLMNSQV